MNEHNSGLKVRHGFDEWKSDPYIKKYLDENYGKDSEPDKDHLNRIAQLIAHQNELRANNSHTYGPAPHLDNKVS